ncbi:MAG: hypothetical protein RR746_08270 [Lachnospiraceae bacterium]
MAVLHKEYAKTMNTQPSAVDIDIRHYIDTNPSSRYEEVIAQDNRWEVFYHLTQMRRSLFNWYEFKADADLLEIGGEFGALTGLFCECCKHVTTIESNLLRAESICMRYKTVDNLDVYAGEPVNMNLNRQYDYIVLSGTWKIQDDSGALVYEYAQYIRGISGLLKPDGKLLIAADNRYGIRYFCGAVEPHTKKPFAGLNQYPKEAIGSAFDKKELISILEDAEIPYYKFYYPLPDYALPQLIYSEQYLPQKDVCERLIFYYENKNTLIADERNLYPDIIDNGVFGFFANSFLVECGYDEQFCTVIFAALTTDREVSHALATTIHSDEKVKKHALYDEGVQGIKTAYHNIIALEQAKLDIVPHILHENTLIMPYIHSITCSDYLRRVIKEDKNQFIAILKQLYACILISSPTVEAGKNALLNDHNRTLDFGVILEQAYIDMVPFNCFYINGKLTFFDQEFVRDNYPAKYVLYRALKYTYLSIPDAEPIVPLESLKKDFDMVNLWSTFDQEENRFVSENRRYSLYQTFYSRTRIDQVHIYRNADLLVGEERAERF